MRTSIPGLANQPFDLEEARKERERNQLRMRKYARGIKDMEAFSPRDEVVYKEPHKGKSFSKRGTVISVRKGRAKLQDKKREGENQNKK
jgi:hypothetical protein